MSLPRHGPENRASCWDLSDIGTCMGPTSSSKTSQVNPNNLRHVDACMVDGPSIWVSGSLRQTLHKFCVRGEICLMLMAGPTNLLPAEASNLCTTEFSDDIFLRTTFLQQNIRSSTLQVSHQLDGISGSARPSLAMSSKIGSWCNTSRLMPTL